MNELSILAKNSYRNKYNTYLKNKDFINQNDYLLSGESQGYRWSIYRIIIPAGYKRLKFTEKQSFVIENYLLTEKTLKELSLEVDTPKSTLNIHLSQVCKKLDDDWTSIYWSESTLNKAIKTYSISFSNYGFSETLIYRLVREADVTNVLEFLNKPLDNYKQFFSKRSKAYSEVEEKYIFLSKELKK